MLISSSSESVVFEEATKILNIGQGAVEQSKTYWKNVFDRVHFDNGISVLVKSKFDCEWGMYHFRNVGFHIGSRGTFKFLKTITTRKILGLVFVSIKIELIPYKRGNERWAMGTRAMGPYPCSYNWGDVFWEKERAEREIYFEEKFREYCGRKAQGAYSSA